MALALMTSVGDRSTIGPASGTSFGGGVAVVAGAGGPRGAGALIVRLGVTGWQALLNRARLFALSHEARSRLNTALATGNFVGAAIGSAAATTLWSAGGWTAVTSTGTALCCFVLGWDVAVRSWSTPPRRRTLRRTLVEAFDLWTGRYIGSMAAEVAVLIETNPALLGSSVTAYPQRFVEMVANALAEVLPAGCEGTAGDMARTLRSTAAGIKYEVATRSEFVTRMTIAIDLFLPALSGCARDIDASGSRES
ncbi:hypothetical protein ACN27G_10770 [Plantactinospora sp. WMMB334]|uniref:hypothetical protein n=1 Tax=Plantactinospora sp. WMMB334 TaxID=3404119 RepID=UPI003B950D11